MEFLENIYVNGYIPAEEDFPRTEEYRQAAKRVLEYESQIIKALGEQFMSDYYSAKADQFTLELAHAYAQGASFAIRLFLSGCQE